jgi:DNA-binding NarL/FixJ family response regulator
VAEGVAAQRAALAELSGAGWAVGERGAAHTIRTVYVATASDAETVMLAALRGEALLVIVSARSEMPHSLGNVVDDLIDDLATLGSLHHVDAQTAVQLDPDGWRLAHELAAGATLEAAAKLLHISPRTAHRRITAARAALGVQSRAQLVRALAGPGRIPAVNGR